MNLLGAKLYDPAGAITKATSTLIAMTAFDTTNLRLTVTVPAHGFLRVKMMCPVTGATTFPSVLLGVLSGATIKGRISPLQVLGNTAVATARLGLLADFVIPGLAPGSITLDAAYAVQVVVASSTISYGGPDDASGADAWGAFSFEIWDPQPIPTAAPGAANGLLIAGSNAATTFATLTSTGAMSVNGVSNISQTGDNFARLGVAGVGLTNLGDARIANLDATVSSRPTAASNADTLLGRNIAGSTSGGRTVSQALYFLRNKWTVISGALTVYQTDDTTSSWTGTVSSDASANPIVGSDPT